MIMFFFIVGHPYDYSVDAEKMSHPQIEDILLHSIRLGNLPSTIIEARALPKMKFWNIRIDQLQVLSHLLPETLLPAVASLEDTKQECRLQAEDRQVVDDYQHCASQVRFSSDLSQSYSLLLSSHVLSPPFSQLIDIDNHDSIQLYWNSDLVYSDQATPGQN